MKRLKSIKGFTLLELLIAAGISVIVVGSVLSLYITQHKHLIVQDQISDMQQSVRAGMEELATKIRMAGYNVPTGLSAVSAYNSNPDSIRVIYDTNLLDDVVTNLTMPQTTAEIRCNGDISSLNIGDRLYIYDPSAQIGEFFQASLIQAGAGVIQHSAMALDRCYPAGSTISKMNSIRYYVDNVTDPFHPALMTQNYNDQPQVYSDNITDLQLQYVLSSGATVDVPPASNMIREVIINMTSRSDRADEDFAGGYRTRNLQTKVKVRNLGIN
jgi:Tfp pilus assembly protein PilW